MRRSIHGGDLGFYFSLMDLFYVVFGALFHVEFRVEFYTEFHVEQSNVVIFLVVF